MSSRNRGPSNSIKGAPQVHDLPPFTRGGGGGGGGGGFMPMPHPALVEEMREAAEFGRGPRPLLPPHHHAILEERLAIQHQEIQGLLVDNQRLAATHVALKQELESSQHELQRMLHIARSMHPDQDIHLREAYDKSIKMEADLRAADGMKAQLLQVRADIQKLTASRQELTNQVQALTQDLAKANADMQQAPALKAEIESMKQVLQRARAAIEYEKKGYAENYEHGQAMENNLVSMARELEKLRAEVSNAEKRAQAAAAVGNTGAGYGANTGASYGGGNYTNPETGYGGNPYSAGYGMNPVQGGIEGSTQYGPGPGVWGAYDMQRAHARR